MGKLSEEARQERNRYYREWRKRNPEKDLAIRERYWSKKSKRTETPEPDSNKTDENAKEMRRNEL